MVSNIYIKSMVQSGLAANFKPGVLSSAATDRDKYPLPTRTAPGRNLCELTGKKFDMCDSRFPSREAEGPPARPAAN